MILTKEQRRTLFKACLAARGESTLDFCDDHDLNIHTVRKVVLGLNSPRIEAELDSFIQENLHRIQNAVSSAKKQFTEAA